MDGRREKVVCYLHIGMRFGDVLVYAFLTLFFQELYKS